MDAAIRALGEKLLMHGSSTLSDRDRRLLHRISRRIASGQHRVQVVPFSDRLAEQLSLWAGSWVFIGGFLVLLIFWVEMNSFRHTPFDPFPYPRLNLFLSILAPIQALLILMAQNRQMRRSRVHTAKDYALTLRTAVEVAALREIANSRPHILREDADRTLEQTLLRLEQKIDAVSMQMAKHLAGNDTSEVNFGAYFPIEGSHWPKTANDGRAGSK